MEAELHLLSFGLAVTGAGKSSDFSASLREALAQPWGRAAASDSVKRHTATARRVEAEIGRN